MRDEHAMGNGLIYYRIRIHWSNLASKVCQLGVFISNDQVAFSKTTIQIPSFIDRSQHE
jgi:hypothetical protein